MTEIAAVFEALLNRPPASLGELNYRLSEVDLGALREELVRRIATESLGPDELDMLTRLLPHIGLGEAREVLHGLTMSDEVSRQARIGALFCLATEEEFDLDEYAALLGAEEVGEFLAAHTATMLSGAEEDPEVAILLAQQILATPPQDREEVFWRIDGHRKARGLDAGLVYAGVFSDQGYRDLWPLFGEAIVGDGIVADAEWLEELAKECGDADVERELRRCAIRLRTAGIEEGPRVVGRAFVGSCNGLGIFPVVVARELSEGWVEVVHLTFCVPGYFRDSLVLALPEEEFQVFLGHMVEALGCGLVELSLGQGVELAREFLGLARRLEVEAPARFEQVCRRVARLPSEALDEGEVSEAQCSLEEARDLLEGPMFGTWLALDDRSGDRAARLSEFMARWEALRGEDRRAGQFRFLARVTREDAEASPLMAVLRERTEAAHEEWTWEDSLVWRAQDQKERGVMRVRHFADVEGPTGADVVRLTLATLMHLTVGVATVAVPPARQPRREEQYDLGFRMAEAVYPLLGEPWETIEEALREVLGATGLTDPEVGEVVDVALGNLEVILGEGATGEFRRALRDPGLDMEHAFY